VFGAGISPSVDALSRTVVNTLGVTTAYDPALAETVTGLSVGSPFNGSGPEAALSEFDARLDASVFWEKNRRPQNRNDPDPADPFTVFFPSIFAQDVGNFTAGITKTTADGTTFAFRNNTLYELNNTPTEFRPLSSEWQTNFEATFQRPLLQGAGTQYNRIAGPFSFDQYAAGFGNPIDGVIIARIRTDQTLADFEGSIRDLLQDVELSFWDLYFRYRDLESKKAGRDSAQAAWRKANALLQGGLPGGETGAVAQAEAQYFQFQAQVEQALTDLFRAESRLRYLMGLSASDGRLIRPADEPTSAHVAFDWNGIRCEALARRVEIRKQKWEVKKREMELIAARNFLLPRIDAVGRYRWLGLGDDLIRPSRGASAFNMPGSTAFGVLTSGEFQEWQLGLQASIPIGYRRELSGVRHQELLLARERALLQDLENDVMHQLADAIRDIDLNHALAQSNFRRLVAAEREVDAVQAIREAGRITLDLELQALARRAEAESNYYESLVNYNRAIMRVHYRKGSLLDYDGVYLAEGPWPGKAYFDALRQARKRDASMYLDYGFTRPNVLSRGPYLQDTIAGGEGGHPIEDGAGPTPAETLPAPEGGYRMDVPQPPTGDEGLMIAPPTDRTSGPSGELPPAVLAARQRQLASDEHQTNYASVETAAAAPVGPWSGR